MRFRGGEQRSPFQRGLYPSTILWDLRIDSDVDVDDRAFAVALAIETKVLSTMHRGIVGDLSACIIGNRVRPNLVRGLRAGVPHTVRAIVAFPNQEITLPLS